MYINLTYFFFKKKKELPEYEFAMIFDASVVKTSMEGASIDEGEGEGCV